MPKIQNIMIPVKRDTEEMFNYVGTMYECIPEGNEQFKWVPNHLWSDTINIIDYERGNSAARFVLLSEVTGKRYYMFMTDMLYMIKTHNIEKGRISGAFTYVKRGKNYGIKTV